MKRTSVGQKKRVVYAFIDSQNLNLGTKKNIFKGKKLVYRGWVLDYKKFRVYLADKFGVSAAFLFIGYIKTNQKLYDYLQKCGYTLVFKPTTKDREGKPKGNIDAELVLHAAKIEYEQYDKAVIVSGDGDFYCLHKYLLTQQKLGPIVIPNKKSESSLLREFQQFKVFLFREKGKLEVRTTKNGRRGALSGR
jgi:uncharacterized LabA/DUF88 family protein